MLKQTITFKDFAGKEQERDLYFNLTEEELVDMQADSAEGIQADMMRAVQEKDMRKLLDFVKMLVNRSYGERDGDIYFLKSPEITHRFVSSAMYSPLLLSLFEEEGARTEAFITGLMPADLVQAAIAKSRGEGNTPRPQVHDHLPKQSSEESTFNEAAPIGIRTLPDNFQPAAAPTEVVISDATLEEVAHVSVEPAMPFRVTEEPIPASPAEAKSQAAAPVQSTPSTQDAAPVQVGQTSEEAPQPFRVKETPLDEGAAQAKAEQDADAAAKLEFEAWKRNQGLGS